jgi:membrane protein implicated in regulation of membrane protease activity
MMIVATMAVGLGAMILVFDLVVLWPLGLQLVAVLRRAARERGGPLQSIDVADALLDERRELTERAYNPQQEFSQIAM